MNDKIKQNVAFLLCSTSWGGLELNVYKLACWLVARSWNITFFVIENSRIHNELKNTNIPFVLIPQHRKYFDISNAYKLSRLLKKHQIKTLFIFDNRDIDLIFFTKLFHCNKLKVVYQQHMQLSIFKRDFLHTLRFSAIDYWITLLQYMEQQLKTNTKIKLSKIHIIPVCVEVEKFVPSKYTKTVAREKLNLSSTSKLIGIMGRIDILKGQLFLVKAIHELQKQNINIELLIVGEPTLNEERHAKYFYEIQDYIEKNNLTEKIHIRGFTNDVSLFYNSIDYFALASESETFGMVTVESMLCGVPVIATNAGGTTELLNYGELGMLYEYQNQTEFCTKMQHIIEHSTETNQKATKAKQIAIERYSHHNECEMIEKMLSL